MLRFIVCFLNPSRCFLSVRGIHEYVFISPRLPEPVFIPREELGTFRVFFRRARVQCKVELLVELFKEYSWCRPFGRFVICICLRYSHIPPLLRVVPLRKEEICTESKTCQQIIS